MKKLRFNRLSIIAILVVAIAFMAKGNNIGRKQVTGCFATMTVTNGMGSSVPLAGLGCTAARLQVSVNQFVSSASNVIDPIEDCLLPEEVFCCAAVVETTDTRAPLINLGDGLKRYKVNEVYCKVLLLPK